MTRPVPDARTRSEPLITGMPSAPSTGSSSSPASSLFKDSCPKPNPESGPFIKSGGFFGKQFDFLRTLLGGGAVKLYIQLLVALVHYVVLTKMSVVQSQCLLQSGIAR
jgi:hypothetical protein